MRNTFIFLMILVVTAAAATLALKSPRIGSIEGTFADDITGVNYHWAYLRPAQGDEILDSCLIIRNGFKLSHRLRKRESHCRITYSGMDIVSEITLRPHRTIRLNISTEPYLPGLREGIEQAIAQQEQVERDRLDSIARADSIEQISKLAGRL